MRLSEKTIELNLCAQINENLQRRLIWFGLTQKQEAIAGFDAATRLGGKLLLFQFKASNYVKKNGARQFRLEHQQLTNLLNRVSGNNRSIFYVFPLIGNTLELNNNNGDLYNNTYVLDVSKLPNPFPQPTCSKQPNRMRLSNIHYADVNPPNILIHSDPINLKVESLNSITKNNFEGTEGLNQLLLIPEDKNYNKAFEFITPFRKNSKMAILL